MIWFKTYIAWDEIVEELSDAEAGRFFKALMKYHKTGEIRSLSGTEKLMYNVALKQAKIDAEHVADISKKRSEARRGTRKITNESNDNNSSQMKSIVNNCEEISSNDNNSSQDLRVKELRVKENEEFKSKELICADAQNSITQKPTKQQNLTPDDHDFWKFAKENAELAETFYKATGIYPVKSQFGRWVNDCKDLAEAEINVDRLQKTIAYMQSENIPLSAPGSCLKTAQWLKSRGGVPVKSTRQSQQKPKYNAFELLAMRENGIPVPEYDIEVSA